MMEASMHTSGRKSRCAYAIASVLAGALVAVNAIALSGQRSIMAITAACIASAVAVIVPLGGVVAMRKMDAEYRSMIRIVEQEWVAALKAINGVDVLAVPASEILAAMSRKNVVQ